MPDVRNCKRCGHIFNYIGGMPICPTCKGMDEEDFKRVKAYLWDNPGATLSEVSSVLEISVEKIKAFLKEGRLEIIGDAEGNMILECEKCGKSIKSGRLCDECTKGLTNELRYTASQMSSEVSGAEKSKKAVGMRYLNKDGK
jgi:flagellar operon protein (TIGR03826 family)